MKKIICLFFLALVLVRQGHAIIAPLSLPYIIDTSNIPEVRWVDANDSAIKAKVNEIKDTVNSYLSGGVVVPALSSPGNMKLLVDNDANETGKFFWIAHNSSDTLAKFSDDTVARFYKHATIDSNLTLGGQVRLPTTTGILNFRSGSTNKWGVGRHSGGNLYIYSNSGSGEEGKIRFNNTFGGSGGILFDVSQESLYVGNQVSSSFFRANGSGFMVTGPQVTNRIVAWQTGSTLRWQAIADDANESGSNAGTNWYLKAFNDAGTAIGNAISVVRSNLAISFAGKATFLDSIVGTDQRLTGDLNSTRVLTTGRIFPSGGLFTNDTVQAGNLRSIGNVDVVSDVNAAYLNISRTAQIDSFTFLSDSLFGVHARFTGNVLADSIKGVTLKATGNVIGDSIISPKFYEEGTLALATEGFDPETTLLCDYVRVGKQVTLKIPSISRTSDAANFYLETVPAEFRPSEPFNLSVRRIINGGGFGRFGFLVMDSLITFHLQSDSANVVTVTTSSAAFSTSSNKGLENAIFINYTLQ